VILKILRKFAGCTVGNLIYAAASILPRDERLWLFGAWNGRKYLDNPKYIYEFVNANFPDVRAVWICKERELHRTLTAAGRPAAYAWSLRGLWYQVRASVVVFTHAASWEFVACLLGHRARRIQCWHGIPIKKIGYDDQRHGDARRLARITTLLFWYENDRCDLVLAASETEARKLAGAFNVRAADVLITGYPRNDAIVRSASRGDPGQRPLAVIYMPTYRGEVGSEFRLFTESGFDFQTVNRICTELNIEFYIKLHPVQVFSPSDWAAIEASPRLHAVGNMGDIYEKIGEFDVLITDFSGIFFDFLITGRPIVMAPIAFESYLANERELYYSYEELCADEPCRSWDAVFARLGEIRRDGAMPSAKALALRSRFHRHLDDGSARRAALAIRQVALPAETVSLPA